MKSIAYTLFALGALGASSAHADSLYVGAHGGFASLNDSWTFDTGNTYTGSGSASGGLIGIQGGWMHDMNGMAIGIEGDLSFLDLSNGFDGFEGLGVRASMLSSLRLRAGFANGPIMPYVTGGVGFGDLHYTEQGSFYPGNSGFSVDHMKVGLVVGGGIETQLSGNLSARLEGLYYAFGNDSGSFSDSFKYSVNTDVFVARVGLDYNF